MALAELPHGVLYSATAWLGLAIFTVSKFLTLSLTNKSDCFKASSLVGAPVTAPIIVILCLPMVFLEANTKQPPASSVFPVLTPTIPLLPSKWL